jgi:hypothetical protein
MAIRSGVQANPFRRAMAEAKRPRTTATKRSAPPNIKRPPRVPSGPAVALATVHHGGGPSPAPPALVASLRSGSAANSQMGVCTRPTTFTCARGEADVVAVATLDWLTAGASRSEAMTPDYLAKPLTPYPLPTTDGWILRTIGDAREQCNFNDLDAIAAPTRKPGEAPRRII